MSTEGGSASLAEGDALAETRAELRVVARKLFSCEAALEGRGAYLGIRDQATLLGQLTTLQRKEEQLREVLLIFLRAPPPHAPASTASPLPVVLRTPPATQPPALAAVATVPAPSHQGVAVHSNGHNANHRRRSSHAEIAAQRASARASAAVASSAAAAASAANAAVPTSVRLSTPTHTVNNSAKTVSLHEALGIAPAAEVARTERDSVARGRALRGGGAGGGGGGNGPSLSAPSQVAGYRHGKHALYRTGNGGRASGETAGSGWAGPHSHPAGKQPHSISALSAPAPPATGTPCSAAAPGAPQLSSAAAAPVARWAEGDERPGEFKRAVAVETSALNSERRSGLDGNSSSPQTREALSSTGVHQRVSPPYATVRAGSGNGVDDSVAGVTATTGNEGAPKPPEMRRRDQQWSSSEEARTQSSTTLRHVDGVDTGTNRSAAAAAAAAAAASAGREEADVPRVRESSAHTPWDMKTAVKKELTEDMQGDVDRVLRSRMHDNSSGLLRAALTRATAEAAARVGVETAARPVDEWTKRIGEDFTPAHVITQVQSEMSSAIGDAIASVMPKHRLFAAQAFHGPANEGALGVFFRKFEVDEGAKGLKRVIPGGKSPPTLSAPIAESPPENADSIGETVAIDGVDDAEGGSSTVALSTPPQPPTPAEVDVLHHGVLAQAEAAKNRPFEGGGGRTREGGERQRRRQQQQQQQHQQQQPSTTVLPTEADVSATAPTPSEATADAEVPDASCGDVAPAPPLPQRLSERPTRKRRKSAEAGGWRSRYDKGEFESGEALLASSSDEEGSEMDGERMSVGGRGPRSGRMGRGAAKPGMSSSDGGGDLADDDSDGQFVDVGAEDAEDDDDDDPGSTGGGAGVGQKRKTEVVKVVKRSPPNAWKRRCAEGNCLLGASFGMPGKPAKYCSAHKDAGMVNVTHRRCEEPGCPLQPSFNLPGLKKALFCSAHKRSDMINVSSPRCAMPGCMTRPSFGFDHQPKASLCFTHKEEGMTNIRKKKYNKSRRSSTVSSGVSGMSGVSGVPTPTTSGDGPGTGSLWQGSAAASAAPAVGDVSSFESSFLSDPPAAAAAAAGKPASTAALPPCSLGMFLSRFGDGDGDGDGDGGKDGGGGVTSVDVGRGGDRPSGSGSFLDAADMVSRGSPAKGVSFVA